MTASSVRAGRRAPWLILALSLTVGTARAQQLETRPEAAAKPVFGYLRRDEVDFRDLLGPPPSVGSLADKLDLGQVQDLQTLATAQRFSEAIKDSDFLLPRFSEALGVPLDRDHLPKTVRLVSAALEDAGRVSEAAKVEFRRPRPYQRVQLARVCDYPQPPAPGPGGPGDTKSYPSGHTTSGWTTALVLAQVAPQRRPVLLARAKDYGFSRVVCGVHYPSDVEAGRAIATAVVARLKLTPAFRRDLQAARAEYQSVARSESPSQATVGGVAPQRGRAPTRTE